MFVLLYQTKDAVRSKTQPLNDHKVAENRSTSNVKVSKTLLNLIVHTQSHTSITIRILQNTITKPTLSG